MWFVYVFACVHARNSSASVPTNTRGQEVLPHLHEAGRNHQKEAGWPVQPWDYTCMQYLSELHVSDPKTNLLLPISFPGCILCSWLFGVCWGIIFEQELP